MDFAEDARVSGNLAPVGLFLSIVTKRKELKQLKNSNYGSMTAPSGGVGSWEEVETRRRKTRTKQVEKSTGGPPSPHEESVQKFHQFTPTKAASQNNPRWILHGY